MGVGVISMTSWAHKQCGRWAPWHWTDHNWALQAQRHRVEVLGVFSLSVQGQREA